MVTVAGEFIEPGDGKRDLPTLAPKLARVKWLNSVQSSSQHKLRSRGPGDTGQQIIRSYN